MRIASLPGDGIGPEVTSVALSVLARVCALHGHDLHVEEAAIGAAALDECGEALPKATLESCAAADAILLGAIGDPRYSSGHTGERPEMGLLGLRKHFGLFANLRPIVPAEAALDLSPLKREYLESVDILFVRELTGGIYFGAKEREEHRASDLCEYSADEIRRVVRVAGQLARKRRGKLTSIDKANVMATSALWREVTTGILAEEFPDLTVEHLLVDAAAMHLLQRPGDFDVIVTENLFGDVLTDEASVLTGSLGMLPSASLGDSGPGLFEPVHGSAPDLVGKGVCNPIGSVLTVAMLLRHGLGLEDEAVSVEKAVDAALTQGV
ncbi:MAG: 3-isopropylmalate dehydrogenase, partial [Planctomycetota bacterium]